jgi:hypothetical protein
MWSGGLNRYLRPEHYWSYIVLPDEVLNYEYDGSDSVDPYQIDWRGSDAVITLIRSMDQERVVYPVILSPMYKITGLSDAGEKFGGTNFPAYKLQITCEFEIDLPTFLHIKADWKLNSTNVALVMGGVHTFYGNQTPIETLGGLTSKPEPEYDNILYMNIYEIPPVQLDDATTLVTVTDVWPDKTEIIDWNAVASGRLIMINDESDWDLVEAGDIIYSQTFSDSNITEQRIANGFITIDPTNTDYIKSKAGLLQRPVFSGLSLSDISILLSYNGNVITLVPYKNKIYLGEFTAALVSTSSNGWGSDQVNGLTTINPDELDNIKNKFANQAPTIQTIFSSTDIHNAEDLDVTKVAYYEFTDSDINLNSNEHVTISLTYAIIDKKQLKMMSYIGKLEYEKHYSLDLDAQTVTLTFPAKEDEGIELYYYKYLS